MERQSNTTNQENVLGREVEVMRERLDNKVLVLYLYFDGMQRVIGMRPVDQQFFLVLVSMYLREDDGIIMMDSERRGVMCDVLNCKEDNYYRRMHNLIEAGVVERLAVNKYKVDPGIVTVTRPVTLSYRNWMKMFPNGDGPDVARETKIPE